MTVGICYVDESHDEENYVLIGMMIDGQYWKDCFEHVKRNRIKLKQDYGVRISREVHAYKLVRGKGRSLFGGREVSKWKRSRIFHSLLTCISEMPTVKIFNVCLPVKQESDPQMKAWDRLINRIETYCRKRNDRFEERAKSLIDELEREGASDNSRIRVRKATSMIHQRALIVSDEGREAEIERVTRKMQVINYLPSMYGSWENGSYSKNIATRNMIEDPVFRQSHKSFFIQLADCAAYSLLKRESTPTPVVKKYGIHEMWDETISKVSWKQASTKDPLGIVRK